MSRKDLIDKINQEIKENEAKTNTRSLADLLGEYKSGYADRLGMMRSVNPPRLGHAPDNPFSHPNDLPVASMKVHAVVGTSKEEMYARLDKTKRLHDLVGKSVDDVEIDDISLFDDYFDVDDLPNESIVKQKPSEPSPTVASGEEGDPSYPSDDETVDN